MDKQRHLFNMIKINQNLDERYLLRGTLKGDEGNFKIENVDCEVTVNPFDTSNFSATFYADSKDIDIIKLQNFHPDKWRDIEFYYESRGTYAWVKGRIKKLSFITNGFYELTEFVPADFTIHTAYKDHDHTADKIEMVYYLTPCPILQEGYYASLDMEKGYRRGINPFTKEEEKEIITIILPECRVKLSRSIHLRNQSPEGTIFTIVEPPCIEFSVSKKGSLVDEWDKNEERIKRILILLSFFDQGKIQWTHTQAYAYLDGSYLANIKQYQSITNHPRIKEKDFDFAKIRELREKFAKTIPLFLYLPEETKRVLDNSINRYVKGVSSLTDSPDVSVLLIQSAFEVLIRHFVLRSHYNDARIILEAHRNNPSTSIKLLLLISLFEVDMSKYLYDKEIASVWEGGKLPFVDMRDSIAHEGEHSHDDANHIIRRMNSIYRMLILRIIKKTTKLEFTPEIIYS